MTDHLISSTNLDNLHDWCFSYAVPDSKVHGANMGPTWGQQDPGGSHIGPMNFAICGSLVITAYHGLVQNCSISSSLAIEILQFCTKPSIYKYHIFYCLISTS